MNFSAKSIISVVLILGSVIIGYFFVWPKWNDYSAVKAELTLANQQKDQLALAQTQLTNFLAEYKQHSADAARLSQSLPLSSSEMHNILNNLDSLTKSSGLTLGELSILDTPESDQLGAAAHSVSPIELSISGSGPYPAFKSFLTNLESNLRLIDINTVSFDGVDSSNMKFNLTFRTYYQN
jgi:Tfp pilus assembly protein PilO